MKYLKSTIMVAVVVLGLVAVDAMAAGKPNPYETKIESPFKGVVSNIGPNGVSVKGEAKLANPPKDASSKSKPPHENVHFSIKGAKLTRDGKPCELKDVQKSDSATVTFTTKKDSTKYIVSQIDFSTGGGAATADEKPKAAEKKAADKK